MSKILAVGKELIKKSDLFASMQFLRFKSDAETKTLTGGIISLSVIIFLMTQFADMILDTLGKVVITSVTDSTQAQEPPAIVYSTHENGKYFMLGLQLWGYDLNTGPRYFDITAINAVQIQAMYSNQSIDIPLEKCTKQHWSGIKEIDRLYDRVAMNTWLCIPVNKTYLVSGNYISVIQRSIDITVSKCNNATDPTRPCATPQEIEWFMRNDSQFYWTPYFMNPLINAQNEKYLTYYMEDKWYVMSGYNYGAQLYIYNDDFQITTDESILPFTAQHHDTGPIVNSIFANAYDLDNTSDIYVFINFFRAPDSIIIQREFQKILDAFAYVGGLLGSFVLILLIITFYNEGSFQLNFASALYLPQQGAPTTFRKYNLFYYIIQGIYTAFRILGYKLSSWKNTQFFYETRKEMLKQLDVMFLFKKIHILQSSMKLLLTKPQLRGLMLQHELNVTEARSIRKMYGIKLDVARLAKHKLEKKKRNRSEVDSLGKLGGSEMEIAENIQRDIEGEEKPTMVIAKRNKETMERKDEESDEEINLEDYGSDSQSSGAEEEHLQREEQLLQDLYTLQEDCMNNNEVSMKIYDNMDPRIKKLLEKVSAIKFENSMKLSQRRRNIKNTIDHEFSDESSYELMSPIIQKRKIHSSRKKSLRQTKIANIHEESADKQDDQDGNFEFDLNNIHPQKP